MRKFVALVAMLSLCPGLAIADPVVGVLQGATESSQWIYLGSPASSNEWFSRYSKTLDATTLQSFKTVSGNVDGLDLYALSDVIKVTYLGTGGTRDANLFLAYAGDGAFDAQGFWSPVYASGGTNNFSSYNPVTSQNLLFQTRAGCSFAQAKNGNTCSVSQIGMWRVIGGLSAGQNIVVGLQTLPLVYSGGGSNINLPNTNYFFSGSIVNNSDTKGWADGSYGTGQYHTKVIKLDAGKYLVAFEDTWLGSGSTSDRDYNDVVFLFDGVSTSSTGGCESD